MADAKLQILLELKDQATQQFRNAFNGVGKSMQGFTTGFRKNWLAITAAIVAATFALRKMIDVTKSFIDAADAVEQYHTRLEVLLKSAEQGNQVFRDMEELASKVPKTYDEIMASATDLAGVVKGGPEEIKKLMPIIVDLSAATGMGVREVTGQMIRMYSAGAAAADMFRERGVSAALGFQAGVKYSNKETMNTIIKQWEDGTGKFVGASEALKDDWTGQMSMMEDATFKLRSELGKIITESPEIKALVASMTESINDFAIAVKEWREGGGLDEAIKNLEIKLNNLVIALSTLTIGWYKVGQAAVEAMTLSLADTSSTTAFIKEMEQHITNAEARKIELRKKTAEETIKLDKAVEVHGEKINQNKVENEKETFKEIMGYQVDMANSFASITSGLAQLTGQTWLDVASIMIESFAQAISTIVDMELAAAAVSGQWWKFATGVIALAAIATKATVGIVNIQRRQDALDKDWTATVPQMAEGGIVTRPTLAMIGEAGPEAVIPLNKNRAGGDTKISIVMENVSFNKEEDVEDVLTRLSDLLVAKSRSRI